MMLRLALALAIIAGPALAQGADAARGKQVYEAHCTMCHAGGQGPNLAGVVGRKAAAAPGYPYSAALKASHITWTAANLDAFLAAPTKKVPGSSMFVALAAPADRKAVIAYLATLKR
ncbi:MAG TPA: c-type cytochrome [Caulobacteraceae bacterium]|jgi:cytochrome c2